MIERYKFRNSYIDMKIEKDRKIKKKIEIYSMKDREI